MNVFGCRLSPRSDLKHVVAYQIAAHSHTVVADAAFATDSSAETGYPGTAG